MVHHDREWYKQSHFKLQLVYKKFHVKIKAIIHRIPNPCSHILSGLWLRIYSSFVRKPRRTESGLDASLKIFEAKIEAIPSEEFKKKRAYLVRWVSYPNNTSYILRHMKKTARFWNGNYDFDKKLIKAIKAVTKASLKAFLKKVLNDKTPRISAGRGQQEWTGQRLKGTKLFSPQDFHSKHKSYFQ